MSNKRLLVTGAAGFIGNCYVAQRIAAGDEVVVYDSLTYAGHRENLSWIDNKDEKLKLVVGNICNGVFVLELLHKYKFDAIINFAAESHVDNSITSPREFIETNINGTYSLLEAARGYWNHLEGSAKDNFRYVQISTDEVYGSLGETGVFTERSPMKPSSPYSASKAAGDHLVKAWNVTYGLPTIITNCTNNYGPRQYPEKLIPKMISLALSNKDLTIYGDGMGIRDWIHVEDHCSGIHLALTKGKLGETYAFGGHTERTNLEVVKSICRILDDLKPRNDGKKYEEQVVFTTQRAGHDHRYSIDDSKSQAELGYTRKYDFRDGLRNTVEWYLDNTEWAESVMSNIKAA